jgi:hypothetical protein
MSFLNPEQFQAEFHSRTLAYLPGYRDDARPLVVVAGPDAHSPAGHAFLVSLANQVARTHRRLIFVGDLDRRLLCVDVFGHRTLDRATAGLARAINPFLEADVDRAVPRIEPLITIGLGDVPRADLRIGYRGWIATAGPRAKIEEGKAAMWGALLASCLAAGSVFHRIRGITDELTGEFSLWEFGQPGGADGPDRMAPLSLGRVLQVGAGAVGSSLDFFLALLGLSGEWTIVDGDVAHASNLNRHLLFLAQDTGYPEANPRNKARIAAERLGRVAKAHAGWYGDAEVIVRTTYDVILALANERAVRGTLQARQPQVLLHATTSANWQAQFHRHLADRDDCIDCRIPPNAPRLLCASSIVGSSGEEADAALPFLSAAAALLLAAGLARLQEGSLPALPYNFAALDLASPQPRCQKLFHSCQVGCRVRLMRR